MFGNKLSLRGFTVSADSKKLDKIRAVKIRAGLGIVADSWGKRPACAQKLHPIGLEGVGVNATVIMGKTVIKVQGRIQRFNVLVVAQVPIEQVAFIRAFFDASVDLIGEIEGSGLNLLFNMRIVG